jgi:hypothetical protein
MDKPAAIQHQLKSAASSLLMRSSFMETCAFDHSLYVYARKQCVKILDRMSKEEIIKKECHGAGGLLNCIEQCTNNLEVFYGECKEMGRTKTEENKRKAMKQVQEEDGDESTSKKVKRLEYETVNGIELCKKWDYEDPTTDQNMKEMLWTGMNDAGNTEKPKVKGCGNKEICVNHLTYTLLTNGKHVEDKDKKNAYLGKKTKKFDFNKLKGDLEK